MYWINEKTAEYTFDIEIAWAWKANGFKVTQYTYNSFIGLVASEF